MRVTKPGIVDGLPAATYHDTICTPAPALSAGMAIAMMNKCPALAWYRSPLNPNYEPEQRGDFDIGTAAHLLFLEPGRFNARIKVIEARTKDGKPSRGYTSQDARDQRDAAYAADLTPLLPEQIAAVLAMRLAMRNQLGALPFATAPDFAERGFAGGHAEQSYFWLAGKVWCKARPDYRLPGVLIDYKTTASANPAEIVRVASANAWHQRAAWYIDGHKALTGETARYWFVAQERTPPHLVEVFTLGHDFIEAGRALNGAAIALFADCLAAGRWPRYRNDTAPGRDAAHLIEMPTWMAQRFDEREARGEFDAGIRAAMEFQRPLEVNR